MPKLPSKQFLFFMTSLLYIVFPVHILSTLWNLLEYLQILTKSVQNVAFFCSIFLYGNVLWVGFRFQETGSLNLFGLNSEPSKYFSGCKITPSFMKWIHVLGSVLRNVCQGFSSLVCEILYVNSPVVWISALNVFLWQIRFLWYLH